MNNHYPINTLLDRTRRIMRGVLLVSMFTLISIGEAQATLVTWFLDGVQSTTGATATGSFQFDADTTTYANIMIDVTNNGTTTIYDVLNPHASSDGRRMRAVRAADLLDQLNLIGDPIIALSYSEALTNLGGTISLNPGLSGQGICGNFFCNSIGGLVRFTAGRVTTDPVSVPVLSTMLLFGIGLAAMIGWNYRNKKA